MTGAGNSRNRTVTYDRPGDVVAATVELLDATGATVLDSVADADGDGSVAIVLPDADGTYQVRVVRENATRVSSTSATVPAVLDRVAPATGAVDLRVTPAVSSDTQRTVSFVVPGDVVTATAQVIDSGGSDVGAPVAALGGSAIVQLGSADGDYRVRLTLTDAAGNAATVLSDPVTLDATAPSAGGAPTVTGAGNSRDRDVSFDRDPTTVTATIEALDGSGTVVATATVLLGDSGTIRLPDADGDYTIRVRQADLAGNSATSAGTPVTLDRVAPGAGPAPTVSGPATARDREISFQRDPETTSAVIELLDGGGAVIDTVAVPSGSSGQIRLPDLDGSYSVRVRQSDAATNSATSPATAIVLDRVAPDPGPAPTVTGSEISRDREVTFERAPDAATAVIEVLDQTGSAVVTVPVPAGGRAIVTLPDLDGDYTVRVTQSDAAGNSATTPGTGVTLDRGAPAPGPAPTVTGAANGRERTVTFTRDPETTAAAILVFDSGGTLVATVPVPSGAGATIALPDLDGDYTVRVRQENRFGIASLTLPTAVALDRQPPDAGPAPTLGNDDPDALQVTFRRAPDAATAVIEVVDAAGDVVLSVPVPSGETATIDLPDAPGAYGIRVVQRDAAGNGATTPTTAYTRRAPLNPSDDDPTPTTPTTPTTPAGPGGPTAPTTPDGARSITDPGKLGGVLRQCFGGDVVLTDVTMRGTRVTVRGLTRFATGTPIAIVDLAGKRVGSASSGADGRFSARVVAPRAARARLAGGYRAVVGTTRSPVVRVRRANVVTGVRVRGTTITITGRVDLARLGRVKRIRAYGGAGAAACRRSPQLKAIGPTLVNRRTGAYTLRVRAPAGSGRLVLRTRVFGTRIASRSSFVVR